MHPKSCKSAKNWQENFIRTLFCNLDPSEQIDFAENCTRGTSYAYARAFQQRFSFFAVTSVTHLLKNFEKNDYSKPLRHRLFSTLFSLFQLSKSKQTLTNSIFHYISIYYVNHCDTCDSKNTKTPVCVYVRVREKLLAPIISHFSTRYVHSPSSLIKFPSPPTFFFTSSRCLLIHFRLSTKRRLVFYKTTACFS